MKTQKSSVARAAEPRSFFNVVAVYEDTGASARAMEVCQLLASKLGSEVELRSCLWQFDLLRNEPASHCAVAEAVEADLIIVAARQNAELREEVKQWVEAWVPEKRGQTAALVALLGQAGTGLVSTTQPHSYLKEAATRAGMDFFLRELPGAHDHAAGPTGQRPAPQPEDWGLNE